MMARLRLPAIEILFKIIEQFEQNTCDSCGYPVGDAAEKRMIVGTCRTVLDRAGMGPNATVTIVPQLDGDLNLELLTDPERSSLMEHLSHVRALKEAVRARQIDAVATPTTIN